MFDYIVVGGGSAGCALANRLSENPSNQVLLLEAGPKDNNPMIHMPGGAAEVLKSNSLNWKNESSPQSHMHGRRFDVPRGKMLGGSSGINGMVYIRGNAGDYDEWRDEGCEGWGYEDVLPYFKRSEQNVRGANEYHGGDGPLFVNNAPSDNPLFDRFIEAGQEIGIPFNDDFNGKEQEGIGRFQCTIRDGQRWSTAVAYLRPAKDRKNLVVKTGALVRRLLLDGKICRGVEYRQGRHIQQLTCKKEVILCAGTIKSPQILQLSGIGAEDDLNKVGIPVAVNLPGVGRNLQEHLDLLVQYECPKPITLNGPATEITQQLKTAIDYFFFRRGIATYNNIEGGAFVKSSEDIDRPDIQMHFVPALMYDLTSPLPKQHGMTLHLCNLRPKSRGSVVINSANPDQEPVIDFNFLDNEYDWKIMERCYELSRDMMSANAWGDFVGACVNPGRDLETKEEIRKFICDSTQTVYHPVGTCKMGVDEMAVVDPELKVKGIEGLRVADASIIPNLTSGNTNAPAIMIGEKCADMILGRSLPKAKLADDSAAA